MIPITIRQREPLAGVKELPDQSVQCCLTRLPLWTGIGERNTGFYGTENSPEEYLEKIKRLFKEILRVLRDEGSLWLLVGDSYWGREVVQRSQKFPLIRQHLNYKQYDLIGFPWMVAFALRQQGWILRQDLIWHKPNPTPESVTDRCTRAHEYLFHFSKKQDYYYDQEVLKTEQMARTLFGHLVTRRWFLGPGGTHLPPPKKNRQSVWPVRLNHLEENHFQLIPDSIARDCIQSTSQFQQMVLDPFMRTGSTALIAQSLGRSYVGFEMNENYVKMARQTLDDNDQIALQ